MEQETDNAFLQGGAIGLAKELLLRAEGDIAPVALPTISIGRDFWQIITVNEKHFLNLR